MKTRVLESCGVDLSKIHNRNEERVAQNIREVLEHDYGDYIFDPLDVEDIYALSLNLLPARYTQPGTIVLLKEPSEFEIRGAIREAVGRVLDNPTRAERD
ncbi:late competence development ComFB family protein [Salidesulfovibrio onnuriiensis]|uniref:late competence development ComFB family protein n=1 Tax=Salidesulfovibrio onnuriiensis TaxID=2583823 RepID=UPI0011C96E0A|nr:late competence development ComFB family protein [Salidesulfovibrio onnuriiensis]